ncbi:MAG: hypothetical protein QNJ45_10395 [Ardenticatenaceae bacterium]|nr:hypothetical protein [Ardenticatenaceae bacterium]
MLRPIHQPQQGVWQLIFESFAVEWMIMDDNPRPQHAAALRLAM